MSTEQTLNQEKTTKKTRRKRDKVNRIPNKEGKEKQSQKIKLTEPIIYDPSDISIKQQGNIRIVEDNNNTRNQNQPQQRTTTTIEAKEIIDYYMTFHKNMINTYNSIFSQLLCGFSNSANNIYLTSNERFTDYSSEIENGYNGVICNRDESLKLIDYIITKNLDTFIKSIELTQKFYNDIIQSYLSLIKK